MGAKKGKICTKKLQNMDKKIQIYKPFYVVINLQ